MDNNPFADLIPKKTAQNNPFADLIPQKKAGGIDPRITAPFSGLIGLTQGAQDIVSGIGQLTTQIGTNEDNRRAMDERIARQEANFQQATQGAEGTAGISRLVGNVAAMPLPGAQGVSTLARAGDAALKGVLAGSLMPAEDLGRRSENALIGGASAGLLDAGVGYGVNKLANAKAGNLGIDAEAQAAKQFADQNALPVTGDDLTKNPISKWAGSFMDNIPIIGRGNYRKMQGDAAEKAAKDFIDEIGGGMTGDDVAGAVNDSANRVLQQVQTEKRRLYQEAWQALDPSGPQAFTATKAKAAELLRREAERGSQADPGLMGELQKIIDAPEGPMSFWHSVRSDLGSTIYGGKTGNNQVIMDRSGGVLSEVKNTLDNEFSATADRIGGQGRAAWKRADEFYKDKIVPYKRSAIKRAIASEDYESVLNLIAGRGNSMGSDSQSLAKRVYASLDEDGRRGVSFALLNKAYEKAQIDGKPFHPAVFAKNLEAIQNRTGVFLDAESKAFADGIQKYMRHIEAAGHYAHNPPTGRQLYGVALAGGTIADPASMLTGAAGLQALRILFNTERGKSLMLAMSKVTPESEKAAMIGSEISALLYRAAAAENSRPNR